MSNEIPDEKMSTSAEGMTTRVVKGSLWTLAGQVAPLAVSLIATPFVIRLLGAEGYGVLILVSLIPTYLGFADFGMSMASTKFGSEAYAEGDTEKEGRIVRTAALIALMFSIPLAVLLNVFSGSIIGFFNVPDAFRADAALSLRLVSIIFVINFLCSIFNTPQLARLRMDLNTFVTSGVRVVGVVATPFVIYFGYGVTGAIFVLLIASSFTLLGHLYVSSRLLPSLLGFTIERHAVRPLLKFGGALAFAAIAAMLLVNAEKGILPRVVSVTALAHYSVAYTLASMFSLFTNSMMQSLLPAFSQLQGEANRFQLNTLFSRGLRVNLILTIPVLAVIAIVAKPFFTVWAGEEFGKESSMPFYILLMGVALNLQAFFPGTMIMASGRADIFTKLYWLELVPYLSLLWVLSVQFGILGVAIAWTLRMSADAIIHFLLARKVSGLKYHGGPLRYFGIGLAIMCAPLVANYIAGEISAIVVVITVASLLAYGFFVWRLILSDGEAGWVTAKLRLYAS